MKILLFFVVNLFFVNQIISCDCNVPVMSVDYILRHDLVFRGEVIGKKVIRDTLINDSFKRRGNKPIVRITHKYKFKVEELIRGKVKNRRVELTSDVNMCSKSFEIGDKYYIYANIAQISIITQIRFPHLKASREHTKQPIEYQSYFCSKNKKTEKASEKYKAILHQYKKNKKFRTWKNIKDQLIAKGKVRKRIPEGDWTFYHEDGKVSKEGTYQNGKKEGLWKYYSKKSNSDARYPKLSASQKSLISDPSNILIRTEYFVNGVRKKKEKFNEVEN